MESLSFSGLACRLNEHHNWTKFEELVRELSPDVIALQEVRHPVTVLNIAVSTYLLGFIHRHFVPFSDCMLVHM